MNGTSVGRLGRSPRWEPDRVRNCRFIVVDSFTDYYDVRIKKANLEGLLKNQHFSFIGDSLNAIDLVSEFQDVSCLHGSRRRTIARTNGVIGSSRVISKPLAAAVARHVARLRK